MEKRIIKAIIKEPNKKAELVDFEYTTENLQKAVGGYIECVPFPSVDKVDMIVNEEGKIHQLKGNFFLPHYEDCVCGTCVIASFDDEGYFASLNEKQAEKVMEYINTFDITSEYDLYKDFKILNAIMKSKQKEFDKKQNQDEL